MAATLVNNAGGRIVERVAPGYRQSTTDVFRYRLSKISPGTGLLNRKPCILSQFSSRSRRKLLLGFDAIGYHPVLRVSAINPVCSSSGMKRPGGASGARIVPADQRLDVGEPATRSIFQFALGHQ